MSYMFLYPYLVLLCISMFIMFRILKIKIEYCGEPDKNIYNKMWIYFYH